MSRTGTSQALVAAHALLRAARGTHGRTIALTLAALLVLAGCRSGPDSPTIATFAQQSGGATVLSILSQVDWTSVTANIAAKVGPDFYARVQAYVMHSAGVEIWARGGELSYSMTGAGTGGRDNSALLPELVAVQQRWERADDAAKQDRRRWTEEVSAALLAAHEREQAAQRAAPTQQP